MAPEPGETAAAHKLRCSGRTGRLPRRPSPTLVCAQSCTRPGPGPTAAPYRPPGRRLQSSRRSSRARPPSVSHQSSARSECCASSRRRCQTFGTVPPWSPATAGGRCACPTLRDESADRPSGRRTDAAGSVSCARPTALITADSPAFQETAGAETVVESPPTPPGSEDEVNTLKAYSSLLSPLNQVCFSIWPAVVGRTCNEQ